MHTSLPSLLADGLRAIAAAALVRLISSCGPPRISVSVDGSAAASVSLTECKALVAVSLTDLEEPDGGDVVFCFDPAGVDELFPGL